MTHVGIETAQQLDVLGYPLLLVRPAPAKNPVKTGWPEHELTDAEVSRAFSNDPAHGIGLKLGGPSGLVDIEGDGQGAEHEWEVLTDGLDLPVTLGWTSARGVHRIFKLTPQTREIVGEGKFNQGDLEFRLGRQDQYKMYSIVPPHCERSWVGSPFDDVVELPLELARRIAASRQTGPIPTNRPAITPELEDTPGNRYNEATTWDEILTGDGWTNVGSRKSGTTDWMRPGGTQISATTNYWGDDKLYVFTTNFPGLDADSSYTRFSYLAFTQWGGNFADCAAHLARSGYSTNPSPTDIVDLFDDLTVESEDSEAAELTLLTKDDVVCPGFIDDFVKLCATACHRADPVQSAVVGFSILATLAGRKVKTLEGTRPNIASLILGKTGCGKTQALNVGRDILNRAGLSYRIFGAFKSSQAFDDMLGEPGNEIMLVCLEEFQEKILNTDHKRDKYQSEFYAAVKEALTSSDSFYRTRSGTASTTGKGTVVDQPSVSLLLTGIPGQFWQHVTPEIMNGGFMGRVWVVDLGELCPANFTPQPDVTARQRLVDVAVEWGLEEAAKVEEDRVAEGNREPTIIGRTGDSETLRTAFLEEIEAEVIRASLANEDSQSAWNRAIEFFSKMELLAALSRHPNVSQIRGDDTQWAINLTRKSIAAKSACMDNCHGTDPVIEKAHRAVVRFIQRQDKICTRRAVLRGAHVNAELLNKVLVEAIQTGTLATDTKLAPDGQRIGMAGRYIALPERKKELLKKVGGR